MVKNHIALRLTKNIFFFQSVWFWVRLDNKPGSILSISIRKGERGHGHRLESYTWAPRPAFTTWQLWQAGSAGQRLNAASPLRYREWFTTGFQPILIVILSDNQGCDSPNSTITVLFPSRVCNWKDTRQQLKSRVLMLVNLNPGYGALCEKTKIFLELSVYYLNSCQLWFGMIGEKSRKKMLLQFI